MENTTRSVFDNCLISAAMHLKRVFGICSICFIQVAIKLISEQGKTKCVDVNCVF